MFYSQYIKNIHIVLIALGTAALCLFTYIFLVPVMTKKEVQINAGGPGCIVTRRSNFCWSFGGIKGTVSAVRQPE